MTLLWVGVETVGRYPTAWIPAPADGSRTAAHYPKLLRSPQTDWQMAQTRFSFLNCMVLLHLVMTVEADCPMELNVNVNDAC
jgi:hypothetical protein